MSIVSISDVHIKSESCKNLGPFMAFLDSEVRISKNNTLVLLGDIFDLMVGNSDTYLKKYKNIFDHLAEFISSGGKVIYVEGNHDFQLKGLLNRFIQTYQIDKNLLIHEKRYHLLTFEDKKIYFAHDELEKDNKLYRLYRKIISSRPLGIVADYIFTYGLIEMIGERASSKSRRRNKKKYSAEVQSEKIKENCRKWAERLNSDTAVDIIVSGHSHILDKYISKNSFTYLNNGFFPNTMAYIKIGTKVEILTIAASAH